MKKINQSVSLALSQILVAIVGGCLLLGVFLLPVAFAPFAAHSTVLQMMYVPCLITLYTAFIPAFFAIFSLFRLLQNIKKGIIFEDKNVQQLRILSWCCFVESIIFFVLGAIILLSLVVSLLALAAAFFGIIIRVIKNLFEKAVDNDKTGA